MLGAVPAAASAKTPAGTWAEIRGAGTAASAGDVNGDGHPDVLVSRGDLAQPPSRGRTWVVWGPWERGRTTTVSKLGGSGFVIDGGNDDDLASSSRGAGDVNGDGLDDVVVGAEMAGIEGRPASGAAYVVFGKADTDPVRLADYDAGIQAGGFRITGPGEFSLAGHAVAPLGDVNGDGLDDVAVSAPFAGAVYVVFGKTSVAPVDLQLFELNAQGPAGYRIDVPAPDYSDGVSVGGGGDVNGDGTPDVVIGSIPETYDSPGTAYVVYGKPTPEPVSVVALTGRGFAIEGARPGDATGYSVSVAGDLNDDGLSDVVVGSPRINYYARGGATVVYGASMAEDVSVRDLDGRGFRLVGGTRGENTGNSVAGTGDVDGDGIDDMAIGARDASRQGREYSGSVYVVYGRESTGTMNLRRLGESGFRVDGTRGAPERCDRPDWAYCPAWFGHSVDGIGDVTGDGRADIVVGAYGVGRHRLGRSYVIRGR